MSGSSLHGPLITAEPRLALRAVVTVRTRTGCATARRAPWCRRSRPCSTTRPSSWSSWPCPNAAHHDVARTALEAGRHVVVDKPFTVTSAEADDLIRLAGERGLRLSVFHQRRWDADHLDDPALRRRRACSGQVTTYLARYDRFRPGTARPLDRRGPARRRRALRPGRAPDRPGAVPVRRPADGLGRPAAQRPGGGAVDYAHLVLGYGTLRVLLHVGSLVRAPGPRFEVHGDRGSFVKDGMDGQIAAMLAGAPAGGSGLRRGAAGAVRHADHRARRAGVDGPAGERAGQLRGVLPRRWRPPCAGRARCRWPPEQARDVVRVIECAMASSRDGRVVPVQAPRARGGGSGAAGAILRP